MTFYDHICCWTHFHEQQSRIALAMFVVALCASRWVIIRLWDTAELVSRCESIVYKVLRQELRVTLAADQLFVFTSDKTTARQLLNSVPAHIVYTHCTMPHMSALFLLILILLWPLQPALSYSFCHHFFSPLGLYAGIPVPRNYATWLKSTSRMFHIEYLEVLISLMSWKWI